MGNLLEQAELVFRNLNPNASAQSAIKKEEVIATSISEYAAAMWIYSKEQAAIDGGFEIPSELLTEVELDVKDNTIDLTGLHILRSLSNDQWLQNIGGIGCDCRYIKSSLALEKKLCDDDSVGNARTYYPSGKKILFPRGTHANKIKIIYANMGTDIDPKTIEANDYVLSKVRDKLYQLYGIKVPADTTANSNPNN